MAIQADNVPSAVELQDAVVKKHTAGGDTTLGLQSANLDMNTHKIVGVVDPTANQDCATKKYVDDNIVGSQTLQQVFNAGPSITIANTDNRTLAIVNNDTTNNPDSVTITNNTTGVGLKIDQNGAGQGIWVTSNNAGSYGMIIQQTATQTGTIHALHVESAVAQTTASAPLVLFQQTHVSSSEPTLELKHVGIGPVIEISHAGTGHGIHLLQDGVLATGKNGLYVYSNAVQVNSPLVKILQDNASSTTACLEIKNDGTGYGIDIQSVGILANNKHAIKIKSTVANTNTDTALIYVQTTNAGQTEPLVELVQDNASSTASVMEIKNDGTGTGILLTSNTAHGIRVGVETGVLIANRSGMLISSNQANVNANSALLNVKQTNVNATEPSIEINHLGAEGALEINATHASASHFRLTGDPANSTPIDGDLWFNGTNMKIRIGATTYNFDVTAE